MFGLAFLLSTVSGIGTVYARAVPGRTWVQHKGLHDSSGIKPHLRSGRRCTEGSRDGERKPGCFELTQNGSPSQGSTHACIAFVTLGIYTSFPAPPSCREGVPPLDIRRHGLESDTIRVEIVIRPTVAGLINRPGAFPPAFVRNILIKVASRSADASRGRSGHAPSNPCQALSPAAGRLTAPASTLCRRHRSSLSDRHVRV